VCIPEERERERERERGREGESVVYMPHSFFPANHLELYVRARESNKIGGGQEGGERREREREREREMERQGEERDAHTCPALPPATFFILLFSFLLFLFTSGGVVPFFLSLSLFFLLLLSFSFLLLCADMALHPLSPPREERCTDCQNMEREWYVCANPIPNPIPNPCAWVVGAGLLQSAI